MALGLLSGFLGPLLHAKAYRFPHMCLRILGYGNISIVESAAADPDSRHRT